MRRSAACPELHNPPYQLTTASRTHIELRPPCSRICCGRSSIEPETCSFMRLCNRPPGSQMSHNPPDRNSRNRREVSLRPIGKYDRLQQSFQQRWRTELWLRHAAADSISQFRRNSAAVVSTALPVHAPASHVQLFTVNMIQAAMKIIPVRQIIQMIHDPVCAAKTLTP